MKFWGFLVAKLVAGLAVADGIGWAIHYWYPVPEPFLMGVRPDPFGHDLPYTFAMLGYFLFCLGLLYLIIRDQRYRCRTCLRRLRMPVATGSWTHVLFGPPRTEYICPYGHGTLKVPELQITGAQAPDWEKHDEDIWKELFSTEESKR
jgi:hypothetical protein